MSQQQLKDYVDALSRKRSTDDVFATAAAIYQAHLDFTLMTITTIDDGRCSVRRVWSSDECNYPSGQSKASDGTQWMRTVMDEQQTVVCHSPQDLRATFSDHNILATMGCRSGVNIPIVLQGSVIGTLNMFHSEERFADEKIETAGALIAYLYAPLMLTMNLSKEESK